MAEKTTQKKKAFALRVQAETLAALEKWAADEFRSVNGQIEYLLEEALKKEKRKTQKHCRYCA